MKKYIYIISITIIAICILGVVNNVKKSDTVQTSSNIQNNDISNKKIEWGIKRNKEHEQPDVGSKNREILEKYDGICFANDEKKEVVITFDEGYEAGYTGQILDTLKENNVKATFFITSHYLNTATDLVERMINEGHIVGNHTVNHKSMPEISDEEIENEVMKLHKSMYEKFGYEMKYIRPPKGEFSERTLAICQKLGYQNVMWSFAYVDWNENNQPNIEKSKKLILDYTHNGEIILLHGNSKTNTDILDGIIKGIKEQGYEIKSLDEI